MKPLRDVPQEHVEGNLGGYGGGLSRAFRVTCFLGGQRGNRFDLVFYLPLAYPLLPPFVQLECPRPPSGSPRYEHHHRSLENPFISGTS